MSLAGGGGTGLVTFFLASDVVTKYEICTVNTRAFHGSRPNPRVRSRGFTISRVGSSRVGSGEEV